MQKKRINRILLIIIMLFGLFVLIFANFENIKYDLRNFFNNYNFKDSYNAKSLLVVDLKTDDNFIFKNESSSELPASLAKLFVIEYALTLVDLNEIVYADYETISLTKQGSSVANIKETNYYVHNLIAAMLVPSGNDAAYVIADYCGNKLNRQAKSSQERIKIFMKKLNLYLKSQGYNDTKLFDPSGYDSDARTTVLDIEKVVKKLIKYDWFRKIISQFTYTAILPNGTEQTWKNTNIFLDPNSEYYNENVIGVKTGSILNDYNLVVLYKKHGKEFLICSLGSQSNYSRYDDVNYILKTIDESNYLKN